MSEMIASRTETARIAQQVIERMVEGLGPAFADTQGNYFIWFEGHEVKFKLVSITEACGNCGGPGCPACKT